MTIVFFVLSAITITEHLIYPPDVMGFVKVMGKLIDYDPDDQDKCFVRMTLCDAM